MRAARNIQATGRISQTGDYSLSSTDHHIELATMIESEKVDKSLVHDRIQSARKRAEDLIGLGVQIGALREERHRLIQEVFFHAVAALDMTAQLVNQARRLGIPGDEVTIWKVVGALPAADTIRALLMSSYANPNTDPKPEDPYSETGYIWRLWNYRHHVSHRGRSPFHFREGTTPPVSLAIDPRGPWLEPSQKSMADELEMMIRLVERRCEEILDHLP